MRELNIVVLGCSFLLPLLQRRHLLCMLPVEVWQEVLGFCACDEYTRLVGLRRVDETVKWRAQPASRELYFVLKHSLLEMCFDRVLPSAWLGGLWQASRTWEGKHIKTLRLGELPFPVSVCA